MTNEKPGLTASPSTYIGGMRPLLVVLVMAAALALGCSEPAGLHLHGTYSLYRDPLYIATFSAQLLIDAAMVIVALTVVRRRRRDAALLIVVAGGLHLLATIAQIVMGILAAEGRMYDPYQYRYVGLLAYMSTINPLLFIVRVCAPALLIPAIVRLASPRTDHDRS